MHRRKEYVKIYLSVDILKLDRAFFTEKDESNNKKMFLRKN